MSVSTFTRRGAQSPCEVALVSRVKGGKASEMRDLNLDRLVRLGSGSEDTAEDYLRQLPS